jgi:hypothetical protein
MCDALRDAGWYVRRVNNGATANRSEVYANRGAEIWSEAKRLIDIEENKVILPDDPVFIQQATNRWVEYTAIAAVAALALNSSEYEGKGYDLTGSLLLSAHDQVHTSSKVIGSPIQCIDIPTELAAERMKASGIPEILIQGLNDRWIRTRNGESTFYANEVERLTGQPTQTFEAWCYEHRSSFVELMHSCCARCWFLVFKRNNAARHRSIKSRAAIRLIAAQSRDYRGGQRHPAYPSKSCRRYLKAFDATLHTGSGSGRPGFALSSEERQTLESIARKYTFFLIGNRGL